MNNLDSLQHRARALQLHGVLAHWSEIATTEWIAPLIDWEENERARRSLERRIQSAHIGRFKALADFDWHWPKRCDRAAIEELMTLHFLQDASNVVLVGPNGVGKSTLARNLAHQTLIHGHTALFTSAAQMLGELRTGRARQRLGLAATVASLHRTALAGYRRSRLSVVR